MSPVDKAVSVVIPTIGRPALARALASVRAQVYDYPVEVVVVVDQAEGEVEIPEDVRRCSDLLLWTGGQMGAPAARNLGTRHATQPWVAYLDDDDEWLPTKLASQMGAVFAHDGTGALTVVSSQHVQRDSSGKESKVIPKRTYSGGVPIADYLFRRRRPGGGRASMYTSTLVCPRSLALKVTWDESLGRHQDWDWLVRLGRENATFIQPEKALVRIFVGSAGSISARADWESSLAWADDVLLAEGAAVYVDFLAAQTLRYAIASRSALGVRQVLARLWRARRMPSIGPVMVAMAGVLPRASLEKLMRIIR